MDKSDKAREYVEKYITLGIEHNMGYSKRYIATVLYSENPDIYANVEDARWFIRNVLNANGKVRPKNIDLAARFALIPNGVDEVAWNPFTMPKGYTKSLVIADLHSRFMDKGAFETAINYGIKKKCDSVIIDGDFMDFYGSSHFDKDPSIIKYFEDEREWGQDTLKLLQDCFGYVVLKKGNHDIRREKKIQQLAIQHEEIRGLETYADYLRYDRSNVQIVEDYNYIKYGKLYIFHGHEYQGGGGKHVAFNRLNKAMKHILSAHSHVSTDYKMKTIDQDVLISCTVGCLCNLHPRYNPLNNWSQGFAIVEREEDGTFEINNKVIINKIIY